MKSKAKIDWNRCRSDLENISGEIKDEFDKICRQIFGDEMKAEFSLNSDYDRPYICLSIPLQFTGISKPDLLGKYEKLCIEVGKIADKYRLNSGGRNFSLENKGIFAVSGDRTFFRIFPNYKNYALTPKKNS